MNDGNREEFSRFLLGLADYYQRTLNRTVIEIYWRGLIDEPMEFVRLAVSHHIRESAFGAFFPKVSDLLKTIRDLKGANKRPEHAAYVPLPKPKSDPRVASAAILRMRRAVR